MTKNMHNSPSMLRFKFSCCFFFRTASDQRPIKLTEQPPSSSSSSRSVHSPVIMDGAKSSTPQPTSSNNIKRHASFHGILPSKKEDLVRSGSHVSTLGIAPTIHWASTRENLLSEVCQQQMCRPACACAQSDQHLCYSLFGTYHIKTCYKQNFNFPASPSS